MMKKKIFCFPYAGGSASIYHTWGRYLDNNVELFPVELAGRGIKRNKAFYKDFNQAVDLIYQEISSELNSPQIYFFGHSMGSLLIYELMYKLNHNQLSNIKHIFFSAARAPHSFVKEKGHITSLNDEELVRFLYQLGGVSNELLANKKYARKIISNLKEDLNMLKSYNRASPFKALDCDITFFFGSKDQDIVGNLAKDWTQYTTKKFFQYEIKGGHFFLLSNTAYLVHIINSVLMKY